MFRAADAGRDESELISEFAALALTAAEAPVMAERANAALNDAERKNLFIFIVSYRVCIKPELSAQPVAAFSNNLH
ncbi:hypothetical protein KL86PLE_70133 [uncultured Pleomorphomonas sp.]|uniref:Uncharacterized protein n=1 Tax=uncultured Pleomorphomonas sp. TaxID=442121 RepID=A0A212LLE6_9HYPH|nr:hypothetical protein KL86PLE_70133 [uncultured Pleomorphomonas sp.]